VETCFTRGHHFTEVHTNCIVSFGTKAKGKGMAQAWAEVVTWLKLGSSAVCLFSLARDEAWCQRVEGRCEATWKREFKLLWRVAGSHNHHDGILDSDQ
jgi:hypothetical protein